MLNALDRLMLEKVADLHEIPQGAYNIRKNGEGVQRNTTANIDIITKTGKPGIDVIVKPYGEGDGKGERVLNPKTVIEAEEGAVVELELVQIKGIDYTKRDTKIRLHDNARLVVTERLLTYLNQEAESNISVELSGVDSSAQIISRSVAQDNSKQVFYFDMAGRNKCRGHIQCDAIIMHNAQVLSTPRISAYHSDAQLVHEAAIGRIESEQLTKLMSVGLTEKEAEDTILKGFLR